MRGGYPQLYSNMWEFRTYMAIKDIDNVQLKGKVYIYHLLHNLNYNKNFDNTAIL